MTIASGYLPILIMMVLAVILAAAFSCNWLFLGPKLRGEAKKTPCESGFLKDGMEGHRYDVKFYMTALVFLIFDVEAVFLFPWAVIYLKSIPAVFYEMLIFIGILFFGIIYSWRKGVLHWR